MASCSASASTNILRAAKEAEKTEVVLLPEPFTAQECIGKNLKGGQSLHLGQAICRYTRQGQYQLGLVVPLPSKQQQQPDCGGVTTSTCTYNDQVYCEGDRFYDTSCMPNVCRCSQNGAVGCTKIACIPQCQRDRDCTTELRTQTAQSRLYPLCTCEARSTDPFLVERFDECLEGVNGDACKIARCTQPCHQRAICDIPRQKCILSKCPSMEESCMNEDNYSVCRKLEEGGCQNITPLESCPLQFFCNDNDNDNDNDSDQGGTLQLLHVTRNRKTKQKQVKVLWSLQNETSAGGQGGEPLKGHRLEMQSNGNLILFQQQKKQQQQNEETSNSSTTTDMVVWETGCTANHGARLKITRGAKSVGVPIVKTTRKNRRGGRTWWIRRDGRETNRCWRFQT